MPAKTINLREAIELFGQIIKPNNQHRILCLLGDAKMGKSHLVTKVFPKLARKFQNHCAVIDLRTRTQTIADILHNACALFGPDLQFPNYNKAYEESIERPSVDVKGLKSLFSNIRITSKSEGGESRKEILHYTTKFVEDLRDIGAKPLLFLFDQVDDADIMIQNWLMDTFLVQITPLTHVRTVLAGRSMPKISGSCTVACQYYNLQPVQELDEYVVYCHRIGAKIGEDGIRALAQYLDYIPGKFVDAMPKFM